MKTSRNMCRLDLIRKTNFNSKDQKQGFKMFGKVTSIFSKVILNLIL